MDETEVIFLEARNDYVSIFHSGITLLEKLLDFTFSLRPCFQGRRLLRTHGRLIFWVWNLYVYIYGLLFACAQLMTQYSLKIYLWPPDLSSGTIQVPSSQKSQSCSESPVAIFTTRVGNVFIGVAQSIDGVGYNITSCLIPFGEFCRVE